MSRMMMPIAQPSAWPSAGGTETIRRGLPMIVPMACSNSR